MDPLKAFSKLANFPCQRKKQVSWGVKLVPVSLGRESLRLARRTFNPLASYRCEDMPSPTKDTDLEISAELLK